MKIHYGIGAVFCFVSACAAQADHFNSSNLYDECLADPSFESICYAYIGGFKDALEFLVHATDEERARLLCILDTNTPETIAKMIPPERAAIDWRVGSYIIFIACDPSEKGGLD